MIRLSEIHALARTLDLDEWGLRDAAEIALHRLLPLRLPQLSAAEMSTVRDYLSRRLPEPEFV
ncbi:hypothetical protein [Deinococcus arenicola]|uniref:Uncharacterized protein n=1 Tax=Deinococcus arenicola TaxID=2994950 RepID=A0ABU4DVL2_9DEIO|nr:hypothetical protein [Deinococcus sp. ZS9-10]MDV6376423.1 hypothetical protein [Deinococcus sp. ZS9-10]